MSFAQVLKDISDHEVKKFVWVHNLSYEFQFLLNIFEAEKWKIENMISRDLRKPIAFFLPDLNIEFRCTYMLTNMNLATASAVYTDIEKKIGQLDYNKAYSPLTELEPEAMEYAEYDVLCVYKLVCAFKEKYDHLYRIPYTQTGEVRRKLKGLLDFWYIRRMWALVPEAKKQLIYISCFSGGYTHANFIRSGVVQYNASGYDLSSAYPSFFFVKMPCEDFRWCPVEEYGTAEDYAYLVHVEFKDLECKYYNTYVQRSKMLNRKLLEVIWDNGRLRRCKGTFEMWLTDLDFELIKDVYQGEYTILKCYKAYTRYLDQRILKFILQLYHDKTTLKGKELTPELEAQYRSAKIYINSLYGCCVRSVLKESSDFKEGQWIRKAFTPEFIEEKLEASKHSWSTLFQYTTGLYITAGVRTSLFRYGIMPIDKDVIYCDTDSCKYIGDHDEVFEAYNKSVIERYKAVCNHYPSIKLEDFSPVDAKGNKHTLGFFEKEYDHDLQEFLTLGAKKYCFRYKDKLHLTLSGVKKSGVEALQNDINNFRKGFIFDYNASGKLVHYYDDNMPKISYIDVTGNKYISDLKYGIILAPTTYTVGLSDDYEALLDQLEVIEAEERGENNEVI